jgi:phospholipid/cholesterol/gamma-HCH transport system substrate-binding protein
MTRGVKIRLAAFAALAVVGMVYVGASYLGVVDAVLGRGSTITVALPTTGGVYQGSEVDYRGVQVGRVKEIKATPVGADLIVELDEGVQIPKSSAVQVASVSAVGEQYLNFVPETSAGPYLADGDRVNGDDATLPPSTDQKLTNIDAFTRSVDPDDLNTVVTELGDMFQGNAENLRILVDSGTEFVDQATAHEAATIRLLNAGKTVLDTQQEQGDDIRDFADGLSKVTKALKRADPDLRKVLKDGPDTVDEVNDLVDELRPVLPKFLIPLIELNQVLNPRLKGIGQMLATLPVAVKNSMIGVPGDGYGHINMQFNYNIPACTQGYLPASLWPSPLELDDFPLYPAKCSDPKAQPGYAGNDGLNQRGFNMLPPINDKKRLYTIQPYGYGTPQAKDNTYGYQGVAPAGGNPVGGNPVGSLPMGPTATGPAAAPAPSVLNTDWLKMLTGAKGE